MFKLSDIVLSDRTEAQVILHSARVMKGTKGLIGSSDVPLYFPLRFTLKLAQAFPPSADRLSMAGKSRVMPMYTTSAMALPQGRVSLIMPLRVYDIITETVGVTQVPRSHLDHKTVDKWANSASGVGPTNVDSWTRNHPPGQPFFSDIVEEKAEDYLFKSMVATAVRAAIFTYTVAWLKRVYLAYVHL